jgi:hypothetical protein
MKSSWKRHFEVVLVAAMAIAFMPSGLLAGPGYTAKFKLPFEAQMGKTALPTGEYTIMVDGRSMNGTIAVYRANQAMGIWHPQMMDNHQIQGEKAALVCVRHNGSVTVRALRLPNVGTFYFSLPKDAKTLTAEGPQLIETINLEASGD